MSKIIAVLAFLGIATAATIYTGETLKEDFVEIYNLLPINKYAGIVQAYLKDDQEVIAIIDYARSQDAGIAYFALNQIPEIQELDQWITKNWGDGIIGQEEIIPVPFEKYGRGWKSFYADIISVTPIDKLRSTITQKIKEGGIFFQLYYKISGMHEVFKGGVQEPEVARFLNRLRDLGVNIDDYIHYIRLFFNWD